MRRPLEKYRDWLFGRNNFSFANEKVIGLSCLDWFVNAVKNFIPQVPQYKYNNKMGFLCHYLRLS